VRINSIVWAYSVVRPSANANTVPNLTASVNPFESGKQPATSCLINSTAHKTQRQSRAGHRRRAVGRLLGRSGSAQQSMNHPPCMRARADAQQRASKRETSSVPQIRVHYISCSQVSTLIKCVRAPMSCCCGGGVAPIHIYTYCSGKIHA
jgi:hypothetical protein